jgi:uncharacterized damage-inducible protein DinB
MASILAEFFRHNLWANLQLLDVCVGLSDEQLDTGAVGTFGCIRDTWIHLIAAEEGYLARLTGQEPQNRLRSGSPFPGFIELRRRAHHTGDALIDVANREPEGRILRGTWRGEAYVIPAAILLLQTINHGTEHRAQISMILTQLGIEPPEVDAWMYHDTHGAASS